jgi:regulator of sigma E protease
MSILYAILLFGFVIFIHELGHFIVAKLNGVKVLKFSLGFGPVLIGKRIGETEYLLSAVPLGGYVKMLGEDPEDEVDQSDKERAYQNKNTIRRACIIFSGPLFNMLTAVVIFFFIFLTGVPNLLPTIGEVMPDSPAQKAGLIKGDRITEIDGKAVSEWTAMANVIHDSPGKTLSAKVLRSQETITLTLIPERKQVKDIFGEAKEVGLIGVKPLGDTVTVRVGLIGSARNAVLKTWEISALTVLGIVKMIQRIIPADTIGGPILIFQLAEKQAAEGVLNFLTFAAVISINLGVLNLLPIPVLDGGHLLFLGIEALRKKPVSEKAVMISQKVGIALLISLMLFAMYNDIFRLISGTPLP